MQDLDVVTTAQVFLRICNKGLLGEDQIIHEKDRRMKYSLLSLALFGILLSGCSGKDQKTEPDLLKNLEIIDLSERQLDLLNTYKDFPETTRDTLLVDSIFNMHPDFWKGYLMNDSIFRLWTNQYQYPQLDSLNKKADLLGLDSLGIKFQKIAGETARFTGRDPKGKWFIIWGPAAANLGGFNDGTMFVDLAHYSNASLDDILESVPHEINHQIYSQTCPDTTYSVIKRIVDEGFACYVSHKFYGGKQTVAESLYYTEEDYEFCKAHEQEIVQTIADVYTSTDLTKIDSFGNRGIRLEDNYPTAIGYFIGLRIVEEYVSRHGSNSWKEIYDLTPEQVLHKSGILNN
jgi:hypothetical protein